MIADILIERYERQSAHYNGLGRQRKTIAQSSVFRSIPCFGEEIPPAFREVVTRHTNKC